jgi:hypothetical protein
MCGFDCDLVFKGLNIGVALVAEMGYRLYDGGLY